MTIMQTLKSHPRVEVVDDERNIGNGVIVTLREGFSFDPLDNENRVRGEDTVSEILKEVRRARVVTVPGTVRVRFGHGLRNDWMTRDVYEFAWDTGLLILTVEQAKELLDDLTHYADPRSTDMEPTTRQLYVRGLKTLRAAYSGS